LFESIKIEAVAAIAEGYGGKVLKNGIAEQ
jgi:hypothetical protein